MKRTIVAFLLGSTALLADCGRQEVNAESDYAKARVLSYTCAGTYLQIIDHTQDIGENWTYFENVYLPHKSSDPTIVYTHSVTAFGIPNSREVVGDTLEFLFKRISQPPGPTCALGGGPRSLINIVTLKEKLGVA